MAAVPPLVRIAGCMTLVTILCAGSVHADPCVDYAEYMHLVGVADLHGLGVKVVNDHAYVARAGSGLQIVDVSDPDRPHILGAAYLGGFAYDVDVGDSYAYIADRSGLFIVDVSNLLSPTVVAEWDSLGSLADVAVYGDNLLIAASGLYVVNVSDVHHPTVIGHLETTYAVREIQIQGDHAYVVDGQNLYVVDLTAPSSPRIVGSTEVPAGDVAVRGNRAFVLAGFTLHMLDISDPESPEMLDVETFWGEGCRDVAVNASNVFVLIENLDPGELYETSLHSVELVGDSTMVAAGRVGVRCSGAALTTQGTHAYVVGGGLLQGGLDIVDVSNSLSAPIESVIPVADYATEVAMVGNLACVADWQSGMKVLDVTIPAVLGTVETGGTALGVAMADSSYAYVVNRTGLQIVDISQPGNPRIVGSLITPGHAYDVAVSGDLAYVADGGDGLQIIDVSDPSAPEIIGNADVTAIDVAVGDGHAFVTSGLSGLEVVDISDPFAPVRVGGYNYPGTAVDVAVDERHAYVAWSDHIRILDITDPGNVSYVAHVLGPGLAKGIAVDGPYLYVASVWHGVLVVDVSSPEFPVMVGQICTPGEARDIAVGSDRVAVADSTGVVVLPRQCQSPVPVTLTSFHLSLAGCGVLVQWRTLDESECLGFNVLRKKSPHGGTSSPVNGDLIAASSGGVNRHEFTDCSAVPGCAYDYFLEIVSRRGETEVHGPRSIALGMLTESGTGSASPVVTVQPSPVDGEAVFRLRGPEPGRSLEIFDPQGRLITRLQPTDGVVWHLREDTPSGVYFVRLRVGSASSETKFLVLR